MWLLLGCGLLGGGTDPLPHVRLPMRLTEAQALMSLDSCEGSAPKTCTESGTWRGRPVKRVASEQNSGVSVFMLKFSEPLNRDTLKQIGADLRADGFGCTADAETGALRCEAENPANGKTSVYASGSEVVWVGGDVFMGFATE